MRISILIFVKLTLTCSIISQVDSYDPFDLNIKKLHDHVAVISGTQFDLNQIAIKTSEGIILFDTGLSPKHAEIIRDSLIRIFNCTTFKYILNTHHHWDHTQGNQIFVDSEIIGHMNSADKIKRQAQARTNRHRMQDNIRVYESDGIPPPPPSHILADGKNGFKATVPTIEVKDSLKISSRELVLNIYHMPNFHSNNDLVILIEKLGILITGDMFFYKSLPSLENFTRSNYEKWISILGKIVNRNDNLRFIIPGHGNIVSAVDFVLYYKYIIETKNLVEFNLKNNNNLSDALTAGSIGELVPELKDFDVRSSRGSSLHEGNIKIIWDSLKKSL